MGVEMILKREEEMLEIALTGLRSIRGIEILANHLNDRLGVISFYHPEIHFNLFVKLMNDRFGIQTRGGCACAGTYGHYLLEVSYDQSREITDKINHGDLSEKPGWIRWSLHPTMTNQEVEAILHAVRKITLHHKEWARDYVHIRKKNEFMHRRLVDTPPEDEMINQWFKL
jgi:selenocysteine lyase/cysteine desulfurase